MLCRLCANNKYEMYNIFDEDGLRKKINFKIQSTLQIRVCNKNHLINLNIIRINQYLVLNENSFRFLKMISYLNVFVYYVWEN